MEKNIGVWLDTEKAYIISLIEEEVHIETVKSDVETRVRFPGETKNYSRMGNMMVNPAKRQTHRRKHQLKNYFDEIASKLIQASEIYIFGPSETKLHLAKFLSKDPLYCHRIRKVDSGDHLTENQMIAKVKEVFDHRPAKEKERSRSRLRMRR